MATEINAIHGNSFLSFQIFVDSGRKRRTLNGDYTRPCVFMVIFSIWKCASRHLSMIMIELVLVEFRGSPWMSDKRKNAKLHTHISVVWSPCIKENSFHCGYIHLPAIGVLDNMSTTLHFGCSKYQKNLGLAAPSNISNATVRTLCCSVTHRK